eukprot:scaffold137392_cov136-Phaeocystis_antarctica.AAC.1
MPRRKRLARLLQSSLLACRRAPISFVQHPVQVVPIQRVTRSSLSKQVGARRHLRAFLPSPPAPRLDVVTICRGAPVALMRRACRWVCSARPERITAVAIGLKVRVRTNARRLLLVGRLAAVGSKDSVGFYGVEIGAAKVKAAHECLHFRASEVVHPVCIVRPREVTHIEIDVGTHLDLVERRDPHHVARRVPLCAQVDTLVTARRERRSLGDELSLRFLAHGAAPNWPKVVDLGHHPAP